MKILVLGGTDLTLSLLKAMHEAGYIPVGVVSLERTFSISYNSSAVNARYAPIDGYCMQYDIAHLTYRKDIEELIDFAKLTGAEFCLVAGWYFMLPKRFRVLFTHGCAGLHASLLPSLRGASPLNWALLKGFRKTGVSLFQITQGVDEGDLYAQKEVNITSRETISTLIAKIEKVSINIVLSTIGKLKSGRIHLKKQRGVPSYCCPRIPKDSQIDWNRSVGEIDLLIRASTRPYPGAFTFNRSEKLFIWNAEPYNDHIVYGRPGQICLIDKEGHPLIVCGNGVLKLLEVTDEQGKDQLEALRQINYQTLGQVA